MQKINYKGYCITIEEVRTAINTAILGYACYYLKGECDIEIFGERLLNPVGQNIFFPTIENAIQYAQEFIDGLEVGSAQ